MRVEDPQPHRSEPDARQRLEELLSTYPLPTDVSLTERFFEVTRVGELELFLCGLIAVLPAGGQVYGSAAETGGFPIERAFYELLERITLGVARERTGAFTVRDPKGQPIGECPASDVFPPDPAPKVRRASYSNGAALHTTWQLASQAALCELLERDRILRSFAGALPPRPVAITAQPVLERLRPFYECRAFAFDLADMDTHAVRGAFLFPRVAEAPLVYGFGAALDQERALAGSLREALQRLGFLWGEELPAEPPPATPSPDYHQDHYLVPAHHATLESWLAGEPRAAHAMMEAPAARPEHRFVDLSLPDWEGRLVVARALSTECAPLIFGPDSPHFPDAPHPIA